MTYSSLHRQKAAAAGMNGGARASFEYRCREIIHAYQRDGLGPAGVTQELIAALRELDRRKPRNQRGGK